MKLADRWRGLYTLLALSLLVPLRAYAWEPADEDAPSQEDEFLREELFEDESDLLELEEDSERISPSTASADKDAYLDVYGAFSGPGYKENVDEFYGTFRITSVDFEYPGKGGLDLVIQRFYNSKV